MPEEAKIRLFVCVKPCKGVWAIPWSPMNAPREYDDTLNYRFSEHPNHVTMWGDIPEAQWNNKALRPQILAKLKDEAGGELLDSEFFDTKDTFSEDAFRCWKAHNRTTNCGDYRSDKKRLVPPTQGLRKEIGGGLAKKSPVSTYLCNFCPYQSIVMQRVRSDGGEYDFSG